MPGRSMACAQTSRPSLPTSRIPTGERRALGDSSHYEEIALIGNGDYLFPFFLKKKKDSNGLVT